MKKQKDGTYGPTRGANQFEVQQKRKPMHKQQSWAKTPGLEKLGLSQAVWGGDAGWAGGTEEKITVKRTPFVKMAHIGWEQQKKTGYGSYSDPPVDIMYYPKETLVQPRAKCNVNMAGQPKRETIGAQTTCGPDVHYDWTDYVDKHMQTRVKTPKFDEGQTREQRQNQGFGSSAEGPQELMYDHNKIMKVINPRVKTPDVIKMTGREHNDTGYVHDKYIDQLGSGIAGREIGDIGVNPVFGKEPLVPDMGGKSKRFPHHAKPKKQEGDFHL